MSEYRIRRLIRGPRADDGLNNHYWAHDTQLVCGKPANFGTNSSFQQRERYIHSKLVDFAKSVLAIRYEMGYFMSLTFATWLMWVVSYTSSLYCSSVTFTAAEHKFCEKLDTQTCIRCTLSYNEYVCR